MIKNLRQSHSTIQSDEEDSQNRSRFSVKITLNVFNTAILKEPQVYASTSGYTGQDKIDLQIHQNCYILENNQNGNPKVVNSLKAATELLSKKNFHLICALEINEEGQQQSFFTIFKRQSLSSFPFDHFSKQNFKATFFQMINELSFYCLRDNSSLFCQKNRKLQENDLIKLGRQIYCVNMHQNSKANPKISQELFFDGKIYIHEEIPSQNQEQKSISEKQTNSSETKIKQESVDCKICISQQGSHQKDYLISPCKCSGSCSKIHIQCLKHWMNERTKVKTSSKKVQRFNLSKFCCQICKDPYPKYAKVQNSYLSLIPEVEFDSDLMSMKKISPIDGQEISNFISLKGGESLSIGRNAQNELVIADMSISRNHASVIKGAKGQYFLKDNRAKFGTFIAISDRPITKLKQALVLSSRNTYSFKVFSSQPVSPDVTVSQSIPNEDWVQIMQNEIIHANSPSQSSSN